MSRSSSILFGLFFVLMIRDFSKCCSNNDEIVNGCRLEPLRGEVGRFECLCGIGCQREFPFLTRAHCEESLKSGQALKDPCHPSPCLNHGQCIQLKFGSFRCECTGTNYYGQLCEKECPIQAKSVYGNQGIPSLDCMTI